MKSQMGIESGGSCERAGTHVGGWNGMAIALARGKVIVVHDGIKEEKRK
jgi:uncharacterized protein YjlB